MTTARERAGSRRVVWVGLSTPDVAGAIHFYERFFGWHDTEHGTEMGLYVTARVVTGRALVPAWMGPSALVPLPSQSAKSRSVYEAKEEAARLRG